MYQVGSKLLSNTTEIRRGNMEKEKLYNLLKIPKGIGLFSLVFFIANFSFSFESQKKIIEEAQGKCARCEKKTDVLDASHLNHDPQPVEGLDYDNPLRGVAMCLACHYDYHAEHIGKAKRIGLDEEGNILALFGIWPRLSARKKIGRTSPTYYRELMKLGLLDEE